MSVTTVAASASVPVASVQMLALASPKANSHANWCEPEASRTDPFGKPTASASVGSGPNGLPKPYSNWTAPATQFVPNWPGAWPMPRHSESGAVESWAPEIGVYPSTERPSVKPSFVPRAVSKSHFGAQLTGSVPGVGGSVGG